MNKGLNKKDYPKTDSRETRDFLRFLRKIKYDHRQVPEGPDGGPVWVNVSIVVGNIRSVTEVTMVSSLSN